MTEENEYWDITDEDELWKRLYFHKIQSPYWRREMGNRLELSVKLGLIKAGISYEDTTKVPQTGHVPDFKTKTMTIECKNTLGAVNGRYKIHINYYRNQIHSRYNFSDDTHKILILPENTQWTWYARYRARRDNIIILSVLPVRTNEDVIPASNQIAQLLSSYVVQTDHIIV